MFPTVIVDDFFPNPDKVVEFGMKQEFFPSTDGSWPGKRTNPIHELDRNLFGFISHKIHGFFFDEIDQYIMDMRFQKISPYHDDQYNLKNRGWIHRDDNVYFGGIIYLNKNPDDNTGTSLYEEKNGYSFNSHAYNPEMHKRYLGQDIADEVYEESYLSISNQYVETVNVKNVYNRLLMFNSKQWHGAQTFGKTQDRLTISFFSHGIVGAVPPLYR